jgi:hypothetical protein
MSPEALRLLEACAAACTAQMVVCIGFQTASQLSFSPPRILSAHLISLGAGLIVLGLLAPLTPAAVLAYVLIALPALVGCYGVALHAHNSIAFRLLHEIAAGGGLSAAQLEAVHSSQELRVRRRLDELVRHRYVAIDGERVRPTAKGVRVSALVQSLRGLFGSLTVMAPEHQRLLEHTDG